MAYWWYRQQRREVRHTSSPIRAAARRGRVRCAPGALPNDQRRRRAFTQMLRFSARGQTVPEIADLTLCDDDTVLYWLKRYEAEVSAGLATKPHSGRPPKSCYPLPSGATPR
jgi:hypothetical protein